jgi:hypothetical protein
MSGMLSYLCHFKTNPCMTGSLKKGQKKKIEAAGKGQTIFKTQLKLIGRLVPVKTIGLFTTKIGKSEKKVD